MKLRSPKFADNETIPQKYTCKGENINPPLVIGDLPKGTKSLVLVIEDIDAEPEPWVHWMVFNISPTLYKIEEGKIPQGAVEGLANNKTHGYEGPCPKYFSGTHHYRFTLYAIDRVLEISSESDLQVVRDAAAGHILESAELVGTAEGEKDE